jgi:membrane protease YdiL (CAAX protease family)
MKKIKNFALKQPVLFALALLALYPVMAILTYPLRYLFPATELGQIYSDTTAKLILFAVFLAVLWRFGWIKASGITRFGAGKYLLLIVIVFAYHLAVDVYAFTGKINVVSSSSPLGLAKLMYYLTAGLFEETLFRGVILLVMISAWGSSTKGIFKAVFFSSLFFGLIHLFNIAELSVAAVVLQAVGAVLLGILWASLVLTTRSLWTAVILHWLTNAAVNIALIGNADALNFVSIYARLALYFIPLGALGIYLTWKNSKSRIVTEGNMPQRNNVSRGHIPSLMDDVDGGAS